MGSPESALDLRGRILFLTADLHLIETQLRGEQFEFHPDIPLLHNVSTDEIAPSWACYYYDETLARYCLVGLRGGVVAPDAIRRGGFRVLVSGGSLGCGSSRETAPYSQLMAGVKLVIAPSIEKIYRQNAQNVGLFTSTDLGLVERIVRGEPIEVDELSRGLDPISAGIVEHGGLFAYNRARLAGDVAPKAPSTGPRPMTICEKILAAHAVVDASRGHVGAVAVEPADALFFRADVRFSHEYVTPMADALFGAQMGEQARVEEPESVFLFRDHLTFVDRAMPPEHVRMGLLDQARSLATVQQHFAERHGLALFGEVEHDGEPRGSEGICHNLVIERIALPGQLVVGTDSHTCMAGALGCLAFGVGATDMANAWLTRDVRAAVPETVRWVLTGALRPGVCAKDVALYILSQPYFRSGHGIGKMLEFAGDGVQALGLDERATLTNMAVEAGGFSGIIEADEVVVDYLVRERGMAADDVRKRIVRADEQACYAAVFHADLSTLGPMVATPGDPRNGVPLAALADAPVAIDIGYGGSCTGGKRRDMDMYASVLKLALDKRRRVARGVRLFIQFGSQRIREYAETQGYLDIFEAAGAELIDPSCGACIKAGPGVSASPDQVTISAINRNFPGRSGPGKMYLASPFVVAASAIVGKIASPSEIGR